MFQKLSRLVEQYEAQERSMADPKIATDPKRFRQLARQHREIEDVVARYREYQRLEKEHDEAKELLRSEDEEMRHLAEAEIATLTGKLAELEGIMKRLLVPKDPNDKKNVILEVRAGTGGDEAALFGADILRMYARYIERRCWKMQSLNRNETGIGGIREAICLIEGESVYSRLKYESGVHRVQRVPATEASGRIHTSTVTVAMLPEAEEVDIKIEEKDLRIDTYCSSGPGGQSVNTTYSAVRITHLPTGLVVTCQDEKSQIKNRARAMQVLRSRLYEIAREEEERKRSQDRRSQVGTGERSEKIRTYNFKENRVTDHRIHLTLHKLHDILDGDLDELIDYATVHFEAERMRADEPAETAASS